MANKAGFETKLIHAGEPSPRIQGAVVQPIFQSSTFEFHGEKTYHDVKYIRLNNTPNHLVLHRKLAALENAEAAVVAASGMAAITTTLLALLSRGDHLLIQDTLYGGTHSFVTNDLPRLGIAFDFVKGDDPQDWERKLQPNTRVIYVETMTNPLLQVARLDEVPRFARKHNLVSVIDNTFASPFNFRPPEWGFDLSLHSCTKYLNGHTDLVAGAVIGRADLVEKITHLLNHLGGTLDPHACFLLNRGMKTLALRMRYQNASALALARFLESHPAVTRVNYPGLESHPAHALARQWFDGFSGMLSFELAGGLPAAERFIQRLQIPVEAPSLGGVETLITRPATTSHAGMSPEDRQKLGITDSLIRVSVGIETTEDLVADFRQALEGI
ncbi:MAG: aminotransferase class I/II-fold pyridoxal phosphate-dependent enzyme [Calditrichaeota bacterium]|nr:MAG: aminotransferase class I/II-fold pyridoxal phosphate-dependent enzyme [Calditrichota bacterium]